MPAITRDAALAAVDLPRERVEVPEWGVGAYVFIRGLGGTEKDAFECYAIEQRKRYHTDGGFPGIRAALVVRCAVDDDGQRIFSDADIDLVGAKSGKALDHMWTVAARLSAITDADVEELKKS
jgi:hypothetical protein